MDYDVIIIGAGPAGGMAAATLAASGARVAILEKQRLPRDKSCGGGLPGNAGTLFDWDIESVIERRVYRLRALTQGSAEALSPPALQPRWLTVTRRRFDAHIIERALQIGRGRTHLMDGFSVTDVQEDADRVRIRGYGGQRLTAAFVIAADGALSPATRPLGLHRNRSVGWGIDAQVTVRREIWEREAGRVTAHFGWAPNGYGWIIPKGSHLSCGVMSWTRRRGLKSALEAFLEAHFPKSAFETIKRTIHPIPSFEGLGRIATKRTCLTGDAAGLVDPISGEGIVYALKSGKQAGEAVEKILTLGPDHLAAAKGHQTGGLAGCYVPRIEEEIAKGLTTLYRLAVPVFRRAPEFFFQKFFIEGDGYAAAYRNLTKRISSARKATTPSFDMHGPAPGACTTHRRKVAAYFDRLNPAYEKHLGATFQAAMIGDPHGQTDARASNRAMAVDAGIRSGYRLLDAGCGVCGPAIDIAGSIPGILIDGVTLSAVQARRARERIGNAGLADRITIQVADYHQLSFADCTFDVAYFLESACYSDKPHLLFSEVYRVLKPGGRLFIKDIYIETGASAPSDIEAMHRMFVAQITTLAETAEALYSAGYEGIKAERLSKQIGLARCYQVWKKLTNIAEHRLSEQRMAKIPLYFAQIRARRPEIARRPSAKGNRRIPNGYRRNLRS